MQNIPQSAAEAANDKSLVGKATIRAARILGLSNVLLARVLGLSESQISRLDSGKAQLENKSFELGLLLIRLFRGLSGIVGAEDDAMQSWMIAPNLALHGRPVDLIQSVSGLVEVVAYVDSRRARL
jgi:Protein of unknown function (DUF2384)